MPRWLVIVPAALIVLVDVARNLSMAQLVFPRLTHNASCARRALQPHLRKSASRAATTIFILYDSDRSRCT